MSWLEEIQKEMDGIKVKNKKPSWVNQIVPKQGIPYLPAPKDYSNTLYGIVFVLSLLTLVVYMDKYKMGFGDLLDLFKPASVAQVQVSPKEVVKDDLGLKFKQLEEATHSQLRMLAIVNNNNAQALKYGCLNDIVFITKDWKLSKWPARAALTADDVAMLKGKIK
jgi:hypothetical protein